MEVTIEVHQEGASYWAEVPELPGCLAAGGTLSELGEVLDESIALWLDDGALRVTREPLRLGRQPAELRFSR